MMLLYAFSIVLGLIVLVWSADQFVGGASSIAKFYGVPPLLVGMVIVGFGTSAPELAVSALSAFQGNSGIALGNAYGSNITNIALILGATTMLMPISVHSQVLRKELPLLTIVTVISIGLMMDLHLSRLDAFILLGLFSIIMTWTIWVGTRNKNDDFAKSMHASLDNVDKKSMKSSFLHLIIGLVLLVISSRILVYGAVGIAAALGVSDIVIGLTVVAIGTSLPELASSIIAARKGESDIALGNILGSNLFNTLAVVGIAGIIHPLSFAKEVLYRDMSVVLLLTISLFIFGYGFKGKGKINRAEGGILLIFYVAYLAYLLFTSI